MKRDTMQPVSNTKLLAWLRKKQVTSRPIVGSQSVRIADLFCGLGGLSLGALEACRELGLAADIAGAFDLDPNAADLYRRNFKADRVHQKPIETLVDGTLGEPPTVTEQILMDEVGRVDVVLAGPPCQGHSDLNNHTRRSDGRNLLYLRAVRFAEIFEPDVILIENVAPVVHDRMGVVPVAIETLATKYSVSTGIADFREYGLPQRRKRHYLVATRIGFPSILGDLPSPAVEPGKLSEFIEDLVDEPSRYADIFHTPSRPTKDSVRRIDHLFDKNLYDLPNRYRPPCHREKHHSYKSMYGRLDWNGPAQTITSGFGSMGQGRYVHPLRRRLITPHEAARIQGIPDFYDFSPVKSRVALQTAIANAVPPVLSYHKLSHLLKKVSVARREAS